AVGDHFDAGAVAAVLRRVAVLAELAVDVDDVADLEELGEGLGQTGEGGDAPVGGHPATVVLADVPRGDLQDGGAVLGVAERGLAGDGGDGDLAVLLHVLPPWK